MTDKDYMKQALRLARKGLGQTSPNPMVGAVIVSGGRMVGQGYHRYCGGNHAEINAFQSASESVAGATLYVTLEPCCHYGKTPPCVDAIVKNNIRRVVIGSLDPNPLVNGKGVEILRQRGIETEVGVLDEECHSLNEAFFKYISTGIPLVTLKFAQTLDGRIASINKSSRWISSEKFQRLAHKLRISNDAIIVGVETILADDPELTARLVKGKSPVRIILDSKLRIPPNAKVLDNQALAPTIVATTSNADETRSIDLRKAGIEVMAVPEDKDGKVDIKQLLVMLGKRGISSVLVEGGGGVITSFLRRKLVDKMVVAVAPKIMGRGIDAVGDLNIGDVNQAIKLTFRKTYRLGEDLVIEVGFNY